MSEKAFQDYWEHNECWGCGCNNEHGLQIKSYWSDDKSICVWTPSESHKAGSAGYLNGGVIAAIIDCHSICTAIADGYKQEQYRVSKKDLLIEPILRRYFYSQHLSACTLLFT